MKRSLLATFVLGFVLGGSLPEAQAYPGAATSLGHSDLQRGDRPSEWGATRLAAQDGVTLAVAAAHPASAPEPKTETDTLRFGETSVPRPLAETILRASEATGVDPAYMMALADKESSFDTNVKSSASSAQGLFQFVTGTWLEMIRAYGAQHGLGAEAAAVKGRGSAIGIPDEGMRKHVLSLRNDPFVSGLMAGEMIKRDRARVESRIGRELKTTELYLAHFLGSASAGKLLSLSAEAPERSAQAIFGRAARANRGIFTSKDGGKSRSLTVAEVHERLGGMIDRRMSQYQAIAGMIAQEAELADDDHRVERPVLDARLRLKDDIVPPAVAPSIQ
nr:transglycosylase SLT domain-containing protein [Methylobacterium gnaphalii]